MKLHTFIIKLMTNYERYILYDRLSLIVVPNKHTLLELFTNRIIRLNNYFVWLQDNQNVT